MGRQAAAAAVAQIGLVDDRRSRLRAGASARDGARIGAAAAALDLRRGGRPDAQRLRGAGRVHLRDARDDGMMRNEAELVRCSATRSATSRRGTPVTHDQPRAARADRPRRRRRALPAPRALGDLAGGGDAAPLPALRPRRRAAGGRPRLPLHAGAGLRRARDGERLRHAGRLGEAAGGARPDVARTHPLPAERIQAIGGSARRARSRRPRPARRRARRTCSGWTGSSTA
jgi:hypothetical protein